MHGATMCGHRASLTIACADSGTVGGPRCVRWPILTTPSMSPSPSSIMSTNLPSDKQRETKDKTTPPSGSSSRTSKQTCRVFIWNGSTGWVWSRLTMSSPQKSFSCELILRIFLRKNISLLSSYVHFLKFRFFPSCQRRRLVVKCQCTEQPYFHPLVAIHNSDIYKAIHL